MKHYSEDRWLKYINGQVDQMGREAMEEHMDHCDQCLATYLNLIEQTALIQEAKLPESFTDQVIDRIDKISQPVKISQKSPQGKRNILIGYYAVAVSITILLMHSGFFRAMEHIPRTTAEIGTNKGWVEEIFTSGWTDRLMDSTLEIMNYVDFKRGSEDK